MLDCTDALKGTYLAKCDDCGREDVLYNVEDLNEAWRRLREDGWEIVRDGDDWLHYCEDCRS